MENLRNFKITPAKPEPTEDSPIELSPEALFTLAVKDVRPLPSDGHALLALEKPKPIPKKFRADLLLETKDTLSDHFIPAYELEGDEDLHYLRSGHSPDILNRLRKGHWPVQSHRAAAKSCHQDKSPYRGWRRRARRLPWGWGPGRIRWTTI